MNSTSAFTPLSHQDPRSGLLNTPLKAMPKQAATLTGQKSLKKHLANGNSVPSDLLFDTSFLPPRQSSEPAATLSQPLSFDIPSIFLSKDDAHQVIDRQGLGRTATKGAGILQSTSSSFDPHQLLDPKGYNPAPLKKDRYTMTESDPKGMTQKHNLEQDEGQGMGDLIERYHNVTHREDRPRKKQKTEEGEHEGEEHKKAAFGGGGKGGEIGEYMKNKRKETENNSNPNTVVDLTGGESPLM